MAYLQYQTPNGRKMFVLGEGKMYTFGRGENCEFQILDARVSREHFAIEQGESGKFVLIDLGSRNGTLHNEQKLANKTAELHNGDRIKAAAHRFVFWELEPVKNTEGFFKAAAAIEKKDLGYRTAMHEIVDLTDKKDD